VELPPQLWKWCEDLISINGSNTIAVGNVFPETCDPPTTCY
jgi:hypothetical protein